MQKRNSSSNLPQLYAIEFKNNKNQQNFKNLYLQTKGILYGFALKFIKTQEVVDDIVSNVYIRIGEQIEKFNPEYTFVSGGYILVRNECLGYLNNLKENPIVSIDVDENEENENFRIKGENKFYQNPEINFTDDDKYDDDDKLLNLTFELLDSAPEKGKDFLISRHIDNLSMEELSQKYNVCENTAKTRLRHGRLWIRSEGEKITGKKFQYEHD